MFWNFWRRHINKIVTKNEDQRMPRSELPKLLSAETKLENKNPEPVIRSPEPVSPTKTMLVGCVGVRKFTEQELTEQEQRDAGILSPSSIPLYASKLRSFGRKSGYPVPVLPTFSQRVDLVGFSQYCDIGSFYSLTITPQYVGKFAESFTESHLDFVVDCDSIEAEDINVSTPTFKMTLRRDPYSSGFLTTVRLLDTKPLIVGNSYRVTLTPIGPRIALKNLEI